MLWFLDIACRAGWVVDDYRDEAVGTMARNAEGKLAMTQVTLRPAVRFGGGRAPDAAEHRAPAPRGARGVFHRQLGEDRRALRADDRGGLTMYLPRHFEEQRTEVLHTLMREHPARPAGHAGRRGPAGRIRCPC